VLTKAEVHVNEMVQKARIDLRRISGLNKNGEAAVAAAPFPVFAEANFLRGGSTRGAPARLCIRLPDAHAVERPVDEDE
jgi:hypothetical protein